MTYHPSLVDPTWHPLVRRLVEEMNSQQIATARLAELAGVSTRTIERWRKGGNPTVAHLDFCFEVLGLRLTTEEEIVAARIGERTKKPRCPYCGNIVHTPTIKDRVITFLEEKRRFKGSMGQLAFKMKLYERTLGTIIRKLEKEGKVERFAVKRGGRTYTKEIWLKECL